MSERRSAPQPARWRAATLAGIAVAAGLAAAARADDDDERRRTPTSSAVAGAAQSPPADVALWREECGACHVAYPARLLPASDWRRIMQSLDRHFGTDASLDAASAARIESLLTRAGAPESSATTARGAATERRELPRITNRPWFVREHDEVPARTWKDPRVGGPARCDACHVDAVRGNFDERNLRRLP